jgi:hypothetical protein
MSQFNAPVRRSGGSPDVYTGLLFAAFCVLVAGTVMLAMRNLEHTAADGGSGGVLKLVER